MKHKETVKRRQKEHNAGYEANRNYQDTLFRFMFNEKESALELYNALKGTDYGIDTDVEFTTLENVFFIDGKNDLGFSINGKIVVLTEHQSTINNNMPVRFLDYAAQTYRNILKKYKLFEKKAQPIMAPEFFVIYTGVEEWNQTELRLSDNFVGPVPENSLELVVKIIDVRYNKKEAELILSRSEKLRGYSLILKYIREFKQEGYASESAIDMAVKRCIKEDVLRDFLIKHGVEVRGMLYYDISLEEFAEIRGEEKWEEGHAQGLEEGHAQGLEEGIALSREHIAKRMIEEDICDDVIVKITGLSKEKIAQLRIVVINEQEN